MKSLVIKTASSLMATLLLAACGGSPGGDKPTSDTHNKQPQVTTPTVQRSNTPIDFTLLKDPELKDCIKNTGVKVTSQLQILECTDNEIHNLSGLEQFTNLMVLNLSNNNVANLGPLSALKSLSTLTLSRNQISNIEPLTKLSNLNRLSVAYNQIRAIDGIEQMPALKKLYIDHNSVQTLEPVAETQLQFLVAHNNPAALPNDMPKSIRSFQI